MTLTTEPPSTGRDPDDTPRPGPPERADAGKPRVRTKAQLRRRRRRMLLASVPVALLVIPVGGRLVSLNYVANKTITAYNEGNKVDTRTWAERQDVVNVIETWKAPFAQGNAFILAGDHEQAKNMYETALKQVPKGGIDECRTRVNLGLTLETMGQKAFFAERKDEAGQYYQRATQVIDERPKLCDAPEGQKTGQQLQDIKKRIAGNQNETKKQKPQDKPTAAPPKKKNSNKGQGTDPKQDQLNKNRKDATGMNDLKNDGRGSGGGALGQNDPGNAVPPQPYSKPW